MPIEKLSKQEILEQLIQMQAGTKGSILAPLITHKRGEHKQLLLDIKKSGFIRVRVNKEIREIDEEIILDRYKWHDIEIVVDRIQLPTKKTSDKEAIIRISDSLEQALKLRLMIIGML